MPTEGKRLVGVTSIHYMKLKSDAEIVNVRKKICRCDTRYLHPEGKTCCSNVYGKESLTFYTIFLLQILHKFLMLQMNLNLYKKVFKLKRTEESKMLNVIFPKDLATGGLLTECHSFIMGYS